MDVDRAFAVKTRKETFKQAAEEGILIAGMHMEFPGLAQLKSVGDGYRFVAAQWIAQRRISAQEPLEISDDTVVDLSDYREENINVVRKKLRLLAIDHKVHQPSMNSRSYTNCRL